MAIVRLRPDIPLVGSPERTTWRSVVETADKRLYVLERIPSRTYGRKRRIAGSLKTLQDKGLQQAIAYLPAPDGETIGLVNRPPWHGLWQICPYVAGIELKRPAYAMEGWRGDAAADFLIRLHHCGNGLTVLASEAPFSICHYIRDLFATLGRQDPTLAAIYRPFVDHLTAHLFPLHDALPSGFCHGDFHPLNTIWGTRSIRAVIDWEFCGIKPAIFDLANLLGCLGMEDPQSLGGPFVARLIQRLKAAGIHTAPSWLALPDLTLAIRFAWLGEWLRKKDLPMIRLEADYMALLMNRQPTI